MSDSSGETDLTLVFNWNDTEYGGTDMRSATQSLQTTQALASVRNHQRQNTGQLILNSQRSPANATLRQQESLPEFPPLLAGSFTGATLSNISFGLPPNQLQGERLARSSTQMEDRRLGVSRLMTIAGNTQQQVSHNIRRNTKLIPGTIDNVHCLYRLLKIPSGIAQDRVKQAVARIIEVTGTPLFASVMSPPTHGSEDSGDHSPPTPRCLAPFPFLAVTTAVNKGVDGSQFNVIACAMPHVTAGNILDQYDDWCKSSRPSNAEKEAVIQSIIRTVLQKLVPLHSEGLAHGGLKATNIFSSQGLVESLTAFTALARMPSDIRVSHRSRPTSSVGGLPSWAHDVVLADACYSLVEACLAQPTPGISQKTLLSHFSIDEFECIPPPESIDVSRMSTEVSDATPIPIGHGQKSTQNMFNTAAASTQCTMAKDIWDVGILAIQLADGGFPSWLRRQQRPLPSLRRGPWSLKFIAFVAACVESDPKQRPSVAELLDDVWLNSAISTSLAQSINAQGDDTAATDTSDRQDAPDAAVKVASMSPPRHQGENIVARMDQMLKPTKREWIGQRWPPTRGYLRSHLDVLYEYQCSSMPVETPEVQTEAPEAAPMHEHVNDRHTGYINAAISAIALMLQDLDLQTKMGMEDDNIDEQRVALSTLMQSLIRCGADTAVGSDIWILSLLEGMTQDPRTMHLVEPLASSVPQFAASPDPDRNPAAQQQQQQDAAPADVNSYLVCKFHTTCAYTLGEKIPRKFTT